VLSSENEKPLYTYCEQVGRRGKDYEKGMSKTQKPVRPVITKFHPKLRKHINCDHHFP
jgi:hypothetical protein